MKYFEEELKVSDYCCDVCSQAANTETKDCLKEVTAIITAVKEIPNKGEKKVIKLINVLQYMCMMNITYRLQNGCEDTALSQSIVLTLKLVNILPLLVWELPLA